MAFRHNQDVEICKKEEGSTSGRYYYTATILAAIGRTRYLVRYKNRFSEDRTRLLTESVDESDIRPCPPTVPYTGFHVPDRVDAFVNEAWRVGSIARKVDPNYYVKLDFSATEAHCPPDELRLHLEYEDGRWIYYRVKTTLFLAKNDDDLCFPRPRNEAGEAIISGTGLPQNDAGPSGEPRNDADADADDQASTISKPRR